MLELIVHYGWQIAGALFLLGFLIFIHELGHFLAAKWVGIKVERFSIGFGPVLSKFNKGETEYTLCALPLGGYVKMLGESPDEEIPEEDALRSFQAKKIWERGLVVIAGPLVNLVFPLLAYIIAFSFTQNGTPGKIALVMPNSPALSAGLQSGDSIQSINGKGIYRWKDMQKAIGGSPDKWLDIKVKRGEKELDLRLKPKGEYMLTPFGTIEKAGRIGILNSDRNSMVAVSSTRTLAYEAGIRSFDKILKIDGVPAKDWREVEFKLSNALKEKRTLGLLLERIDLKAKVDPKNKEALKPQQIKVKVDFKESATFQEFGIESPEKYVFSLIKDSPIAKVLSIGDKVESINGKKLNSLIEADSILREIKSDTIAISYFRDDELKSAEVTLTRNLKMVKYIPKYKPIIFGVGLAPYLTAPNPVAISIPFSDVPRMAWEQTMGMFEMMFLSFGALFSGSASLKSLGGPIMILQVAGNAAVTGIMAYLSLLCFISINLGLINLLPIPVLDGGHLMFLLVEIIQGKPPVGKVRQAMDLVGMSFLLLLMVFTIFNDLFRFFES